jgi:oligopeptide/dipeptide ABC transporter ATP-binding protein
LRVVAGISYSLHPGRTLGIVGESGCGKSMTALALMGLAPKPAKVAGSIRLGGEELAGRSGRAWRDVRGNRIALVFQEPMTALNPLMPIGDQIAEAMILHLPISWREAGEHAVGLLDAVGIGAARQRAADYPHLLSGGMRQRAMIAMALSCRPDVLIADEPTTALDVTIQAQILDLLLKLQEEYGMAIQLVSHNLAVVSEMADEILVMYAGRIVERAPAETLFAAPAHPYTQGLIATLPQPGRRAEFLPVIPGNVASPGERLPGCYFADRCFRADAGCREAEPVLEAVAEGHEAACFKVGR